MPSPLAKRASHSVANDTPPANDAAYGAGQAHDDRDQEWWASEQAKWKADMQGDAPTQQQRGGGVDNEKDAMQRSRRELLPQFDAQVDGSAQDDRGSQAGDSKKVIRLRTYTISKKYEAEALGVQFYTPEHGPGVRITAMNAVRCWLCRACAVRLACVCRLEHNRAALIVRAHAPAIAPCLPRGPHAGAPWANAPWVSGRHCVRDARVQMGPFGRCGDLEDDDVLVEINGRPVLYAGHAGVITCIKDSFRSSNQMSVTVCRPMELNKLEEIRAAATESSVTKKGFGGISK